MDLTYIYELVFAAAGITALVTFLVNVGKSIRVVKDGDAQKWVRVINFLIFASFWIIGNYYPDIDLLLLDKYAATIAQSGVLILGVLIPGANWAAPIVHDKLKGIPVVGKSFSG